MAARAAPENTIWWYSLKEGNKIRRSTLAMHEGVGGKTQTQLREGKPEDIPAGRKCDDAKRVEFCR